MSEYVGLKKGKVHESHIISEYYCGGCGWPVTDHDSYCSECGGGLHRITNRPTSQSDALKTEETTENGATKSEMRDFDDSREKLEADVRKCYTHTVTTAMWPPSANKHMDMVSVPIDTVLGWLDRQAAITHAEVNHDTGIGAHEEEEGEEMTMRVTRAEFLGLKPCPHCGGAAEFDWIMGALSLRVIRCECGAMITMGNVTDAFDGELAELWNNRAVVELKAERPRGRRT